MWVTDYFFPVVAHKEKANNAPRAELSAPKIILKKDHQIDGMCSVHKDLVHILLHTPPLSLNTSRLARTNIWTWWQHSKSTILGKAEPSPTLQGPEKLIQVDPAGWLSISENKSSPLCYNHSKTSMLLLLALLTTLTSANWFIWLHSPMRMSVWLSREYLPSWDEASLPSGPDSIPLWDWFLKNRIF